MSLRLRLLAAVGVVALIALLAADAATYSALRAFLYQRVDQSLSTAHVALERQLRANTAPDALNAATIAPGVYVEVRDPQGKTIGQAIAGRGLGGKQTAPRLPAKLTGFRQPTGRQLEASTTFTAGSVEPGGPQFKVSAWQLADGDQLILALPLDEPAGTLHRLLLIEAAVTAVAVAVVAAIGWWAVRVGLRPLVDMENTATAIAGGDLDRRVSGDTAHTEIGRLARALNAMLARIHRAFDERDATEAELRASEARLRRFVADASHELRTPIAAVSAYAELFERGASSRPGDLERVMTGIRSETGRMGQLVEELLLLARLDEGRPIALQPIEIVSLAAQAVSAALTIDERWPITLVASRPVEVNGDEARLRQVIDNLLSNVRAHTPPGTSTVVTIGEEGDTVTIAVADNGPGITSNQASQVFERFYRADPSRLRDRGGSGLGLAIVAAIIAAHGGHVEAAPNPAGGALFTVHLPVAAPADEAA
jgi:two-component system OmpR family sensor kinase